MLGATGAETGSGRAADVEAVSELTPCGGADHGGSGSSSSADEAPATSPPDTEPYSAAEWKCQQMVRRRAG